MVREEGPSSLARGVGPNVFRAILMNASQLASCVDTTFILYLSDIDFNIRKIRLLQSRAPQDEVLQR